MDRRTTRPGEALRVPLERAIGLRFKQLGDFVAELAADLSTGGMFIRTRRPHPVGSVFEFELRLGSDRPLIAGKAQVAWVRRRSETPDTPAGMGVRFVELDDASRRQIAELVAAHETKDGRPRDLDEPQEDETAAGPPGRGAAAARPETAAPAPQASAAAEVRSAAPSPPAAASPSPPVGRVAFASQRRRRSRGLWILLPIALAAALAAVLWLRPGPAAPPPAEAAPTEPEAPAPAADSAGDRLEAEDPDPVRAVDEWARAWTEQRVDDYLAAYSMRFEPANGLDRADWERQRRQRILAPAWIKVELALVDLESTGTDRSRVRFVQVYQSDSYRDVVHKVLDLEREGAGWKIARETVEP